MLVKIIVILFCSFLGFRFACAQPTISSVSGSFAHKGTVIIFGTNFGTKSPAAPLLWDDAEDRALNDPEAVTNFGYVDVWPKPTTPDDYMWNYRAHPYTNPHLGAQPMPGAHSSSNNYLAAGAYQEPVNSARNLCLGAYYPSGSNTWYAIWYVRLDNNTWPTSPGAHPNYKCWNLESNNGYHAGNHLYEGCTSCIHNRSDPVGIGLNGYVCNESHADAAAPSEINQWIHQEVIFRNTNQLLRDTKYDNSTSPVRMHDKSCSGTALGWTPKAFFFGGFNRHDANDNGGYTHSGMWRYFDDIYADITWSRVMLGNNQTYDNCTIIEPQIPLSWNDTITITVNRGALAPCETHYLFVFDADNNHNMVGYPVSICTAAGEPPCPPTGLKIVE